MIKFFMKVEQVCKSLNNVQECCVNICQTAWLYMFLYCLHEYSCKKNLIEIPDLNNYIEEECVDTAAYSDEKYLLKILKLKESPGTVDGTLWNWEFSQIH